MNPAYKRCPSLENAVPHGRWSLQDMLNHWGYRYLVIGNALTHMEMSLEVHLGLIGDSEHDRRTSDIQTDGGAREYLLAKCHEIEGFLSDQDLGTIPGNVASLMAKIMVARRNKAPLYAVDLLKDVQRLKNDFALILSNRFFYSVRPELNDLYGKPELFGEKVAKKFPKATSDIEWAGNCLALGQPTSCVLHLDRAMEIALQKLATKLKITPSAKDTMGKILNDMNKPINDMPDKTETEKRKKERWSECRINLSHVKMAWRDPTAHGKKATTTNTRATSSIA